MSISFLRGIPYCVVVALVAYWLAPIKFFICCVSHETESYLFVVPVLHNSIIACMSIKTKHQFNNHKSELSGKRYAHCELHAWQNRTYKI